MAISSLLMIPILLDTKSTSWHHLHFLKSVLLLCCVTFYWCLQCDASS